MAGFAHYSLSGMPLSPGGRKRGTIAKMSRRNIDTVNASRKSMAVVWGSAIQGRERTTSGDSDGQEIMDEILLAELKTQIMDDRMAKNKMTMAVPADIRDALLFAVLNYIRFGQVVKGKIKAGRKTAAAAAAAVAAATVTEVSDGAQQEGGTEVQENRRRISISDARNLIQRGIAVPAKMTADTEKKERELFLCYTSLTDADMLGLVRSKSLTSFVPCSAHKRVLNCTDCDLRIVKPRHLVFTKQTGGHEIAKQIGSGKVGKAQPDSRGGAILPIAEGEDVSSTAEAEEVTAEELDVVRKEREATVREIARSSVVAFNFEYIR